MRVFILSLFITLTVNSQTILFKGKVIDGSSGESVAYANISFLSKPKGISSEENGTFSLEIDKKLLHEKIHISCLNYKDTIVLASSVQDRDIKLKQESMELDEVVISKKVNKKIILDKVKGRVIPLYSGGVVKMLAKYFPCNYPEDYYLDKINLHFSKRGSRKSKFRIRVFSVDSLTGKPNIDLLLKSIPISLEKDQKKTEVDLSEFMLEIPKNGVYIAFEKLFIEENKFIVKRSYLKEKVFYSPVIGLTKSKDIKSEDCKVFLYNNGEWWLSSKVHEKDTWVPAISLTLSN